MFSSVVFPLSFSIALPLCTHIFHLLLSVWEMKRFLETQKLVLKNCAIFMVSLLVGDLEMSKESLKITAFC